MKSLLLFALLIPAADVPTDPVRAVMYEFTYNEKTMLITHAQVIGGFPTLEACTSAQPRAMAAGMTQLDADEKIQLQCSGIREQPEAQEPPAPKIPGVAL